jgi:hypothetical protein
MAFRLLFCYFLGALRHFSVFLSLIKGFLISVEKSRGNLPCCIRLAQTAGCLLASRGWVVVIDFLGASALETFSHSTRTNRARGRRQVVHGSRLFRGETATAGNNQRFRLYYLSSSSRPSVLVSRRTAAGWFARHGGCTWTGDGGGGGRWFWEGKRQKDTGLSVGGQWQKEDERFGACTSNVRHYIRCLIARRCREARTCNQEVV